MSHKLSPVERKDDEHEACGAGARAAAIEVRLGEREYQLADSPVPK